MARTFFFCRLAGLVDGTVAGRLYPLAYRSFGFCRLAGLVDGTVAGRLYPLAYRSFGFCRLAVADLLSMPTAVRTLHHAWLPDSLTVNNPMYRVNSLQRQRRTRRASLTAHERGKVAKGGGAGRGKSRFEREQAVVF